MTELYGYIPILRIEMESFVNPETSRHLRSLRRALATGPATAIVLLSGANLLLAGCAALPPKADLKPISAPQTFAADKSLAAPSGDWPSDNWWKGFGDPQLDTLIAEGLAGATDLREAEARFAKARAMVSTSRAATLPSLDATAQGGLAQQSDNYLFPSGFAPRGWPDYGQGSLNLNWDLDFFGRNRAALAAARGDAAAAGAEAASARLAVSAGIAAAYADLADHYAQRDAADGALKVRRQTLELIEGRRAAQLENEGAVARARSAAASAEGELAALDETIALDRNRIAALLGQGPDRGLTIARPADMAHAAFGLPANLPANLIGRRPDVIAARLRTEAAAARIKQARAAFYPDVNLSASIGLQAMGIGSLFKTGSDFGSVGPALTLPIFEGGKLRGQLHGAEADYEEAVAQYDGTLTQALRDVADAAASQRALDTRLAAAQAAEQAAETAWIVAGNRYRGGLATYLDVLTAEDSLISARRTVASLQTHAFALDVALVRALGGGFRSEG